MNGPRVKPLKVTVGRANHETSLQVAQELADGDRVETVREKVIFILKAFVVRV
jgi:hypothetical protein